MINLHILTYSTDDHRLLCLYQSAALHNVNIRVIKNAVWKGFSDKLTGMLNVIDDIPDGDVICFVDAYDVLVNHSEAHTLNSFLKFDADLIFSSELNCFPEKFRGRFNKSEWTNFHYLNSGGYIGYKHAIKDFLMWKSFQEVEAICEDGGDQSYACEYYLSNQDSRRIVIDSDCRIFLSMFGVDWSEISLYRGVVYNDILKNAPCFLHFNGNSWRLADGNQSVLPGLINKVHHSKSMRSALKIVEWEQLRGLAWPRLPQI